MKKLTTKAFGISLFALFLFLGLGNTASADNNILFGQNHYYSVIFRGNGEAITYAKLVINNPDSKPMTEFSFETPNISITEMAAYQMTLPKVCVEYDYSTTKTNSPCLKYEDSDYTSSYYYGYYRSDEKPEYQKIELANTGNTYKFTLPKQIDAYKSSAIIVSYATKGYTKESLGLYKFNFETLKVASRIQELRVAIETDSDLYLKNKDAEVNYSTSNSISSTIDSATISSKALDEVVSNIGSYGQINKVGRSLSPNESFSVKGEYAKNWFRLYMVEVITTILVILGIFAGLFFLPRYLNKRNKKEKTVESKISKSESNSIDKTKEAAPPLKIALAGLLSVLLTIILTIAYTYLSSSDILYPLFSYGSTVLYAVIKLVLVLVALFTYLAAIFGPAIYIGVKNGWKSSLYVLLSEFLWFIFMLVIFIALFQSGVITDPFYGGGIYPVDATKSAI